MLSKSVSSGTFLLSKPEGSKAAAVDITKHPAVGGAPADGIR
jgi:hypothetical protein